MSSSSSTKCEKICALTTKCCLKNLGIINSQSGENIKISWKTLLIIALSITAFIYLIVFREEWRTSDKCSVKCFTHRVMQWTYHSHRWDWEKTSLKTINTVFSRSLSVSRNRTSLSIRSLLDWTSSDQLLVHFSSFSCWDLLLGDTSTAEAVLGSTLDNLGVLLTANTGSVSSLCFTRPIVSSHLAATAAKTSLRASRLLSVEALLSIYTGKTMGLCSATTLGWGSSRL